MYYIYTIGLELLFEHLFQVVFIEKVVVVDQKI